MLMSVKRSEIFNEFTPEEQEYWFSIKEKAVAHHVDTLYYSVYIKGDRSNIDDPRIIGVSGDDEHPVQIGLVGDLDVLKEAKRADPSSSVEFHGLQVMPYGGYSIYSYWIQEPEKFDIFIARNIINDDTPRINVQLRTFALVIDGLYEAIEESLECVRNILTEYNLEIDYTHETRIDYAFHTNSIQKPLDVIGTDALDQHLITAFARLGLDGEPAHRIDESLNIDYMTLGSRKSDYLFFRSYEKTKEVIQMNYKAFFLQKWRDRGLISRYDQYVYEYAYKLGSYRTGVLVGRINWYLEHGKNMERKAELEKFLLTYFEKSSNNTALEKAIKHILPPTTKVFNVEFQTQRKFYSYYNKFIDSNTIELSEDASPEALRLYKVLGLRRVFINKLLTHYVSFVESRFADELKEQDWWRRIRCCRIKDVEDQTTLDAWRDYSRRVDIGRQRSRVAGSIASISMLYRESTEGNDFAEDMIDALTFLNDNDKVDYIPLKAMEMQDYKTVKRRKARQLAPILKKLNVDELASVVPESYVSGELNEAQIARLDNVDCDSRYLPGDYQDSRSRDSWRCIRCDSIRYGDNDLYKLLYSIKVYPFYEGICKRCQRIFGKRK